MRAFLACAVTCLALPAEGQVTTLVSRALGGGSGNDFSEPGGISADGRYVAFFSLATNLVPGGGAPGTHAFVRDMQQGTTELVDLGPGGVIANGSAAYVTMSTDGRFVAWTSYATNLIAGDTNGAMDVFVRDRV
jgi:hypothetical protein